MRTGTHTRPQNRSQTQTIDEVDGMILLQLCAQFHRKPRKKIHSPFPNKDRVCRPSSALEQVLSGRRCVPNSSGTAERLSMARIGR
jgi:hypothetical protein